MSNRYSDPPKSENAIVAEVEQILGGVSLSAHSQTDLQKPAAADNALWICACVSVDDSPTWLIYDTPSGGLAWRRVPDGVEPLHLVDARLSAGGHADPAEVLSWLLGDVPDPWVAGQYGQGDDRVLDELRRKIRPT